MPEPQQFRYDFTDEQVGQPPDVNWESYPTNAVLVVTPEHTLKLEVATQFNFSASMFPRAIQDRLDTVAVVAKFRHHGGDEGGNFGFSVNIADFDEFVYHFVDVNIFKDGSTLSPTYPDGALVLTVGSDSAGEWLESPPLPQPEPDSYYWFYAVMTPDAIKIRVWKDGDPLPLTWDLEADFGVGHPGDFYIVSTGFGAPGTYLEIDYIGIGINGAPAPFPIDIAELSLRSATSTRAEATVAAPVDVTGRSVTPTRANVTLDTTNRVAGRTGTSTRGDAGLRAAVTLRGLSSATAIRAAASLETAAIYGTRTSPPILLPDVVAESVAVTWEEDLPEGASILMQVSVNGGPWRTLRSGEPIPGLTGPLGGRSLVLRNLLGTTDPQALPVLKAPKIVIQERTLAAAVWLEWPQGVFLLSSPTRRADEAGGVIREIEAYDQLVILRDDRVLDRYVVPAGTNYISAVDDLLQSAGIQQRNLFPSPLTLPADREWAPGTPKLEIINDLLQAINYRSLTFDALGVAIAEPYVSPAEQAAEYRYADDGESVILPEATETLDLFNVANAWVLVVSDPDREPIVATYRNDSPQSPTSTVNRGRVIVDYREYEEAADEATLQARAERIAFEASQVVQAIEWESWIMPHHGDSDVYELVFSPLGVAQKFSEHTWEMDLRVDGRMKHRARRVIPI